MAGVALMVQVYPFHLKLETLHFSITAIGGSQHQQQFDVGVLKVKVLFTF